MRFAILTLSILLSQCLLSQSDTVLIRQHLEKLTQGPPFRNYKHIERLDEIAAYIYGEFSRTADTTYYQTYKIGSHEYRNVIASFGPDKAERIIIGAHYDVCGDQAGADDNASGVTGLLELARLLDTIVLPYRIDVVAYTLEEPPYFRTQQMGSAIHAQSLVRDSIPVKGMICLEMIGYYDDSRGSQSYPAGFLKLFYGSRGNYITVVDHFGGGRFARRFARRFRSNCEMRSKKFKGPAALPGIDFSDHLNYWAEGYSAVMLTDTAFYRNKAYHQSDDVINRLDLKRMALVINGVLLTLARFK